MSLIPPRAKSTADYRPRIALDRHALDIAAEEQPQLFLEVSEQHVLCVSRRDQARDELLRVDAQLGRETRAAMEAAGQKPTEGKIADVVIGDPKHIAAADKAAKLNHEVDDWGALRSALEHRKSMIRELATLYASGYYTVGSARGAGGAVKDANYKSGREQLAKQRAER